MYVITQNSDVIRTDNPGQVQAENPDSFLVKSEEDLESVPTPILVGVYNAATGKKIKKFADRDTAVSKTFAVLEEASSGANVTTTAAAAPAESEDDGAEKRSAAAKKGAKAKAAGAKKEKAPKKEGGAGKPGRVSSFLGQRFYPTQLGLSAKRHGESRRTRSFAIIAEKPGLTYDEYVKAGGSPDDLAIIINRRKHAVSQPEDAKAPKAPPVVEDPKGLAEKAEARKAARAAKKAAEPKKEKAAPAKKAAAKKAAPPAKKAPAKKGKSKK